MDVVIIRDCASRAELIHLFLQLESGKHLDSPCVEYYKVACCHCVANVLPMCYQFVASMLLMCC